MMTPECRCESCSDEPLYTYTKAFMRALEARAVCRLPSAEHRRAYLADIERRRGKEAAEELAGLVREEWKNRKPAKAV